MVSKVVFKVRGMGFLDQQMQQTDVLPGSRQQRRAAAAEAEAEPVFDPSKEPGARMMRLGP